MIETRAELIKDLVADLKPVARAGDTRRALALWLALAAPYTAAVALLTGDLRSGVLTAFTSSPAAALEALAAIVAIGALAHAALRTAVPGGPGLARQLAVPLAALAAWVAFYVVALWQPVPPAALLGGRTHCFWQTLLFSLPNLALLLWFARRLMPLSPRATAAAAAAAATALPAALVQLSCVSEPAHALSHHLAPIAITAVAVGLLGGFVLTRRAALPRKHRVVTLH